MAIATLLPNGNLLIPDGGLEEGTHIDGVREIGPNDPLYDRYLKWADDAMSWTQEERDVRGLTQYLQERGIAA
jgi:hypothetical protein